MNATRTPMPSSSASPRAVLVGVAIAMVGVACGSDGAAIISEERETSSTEVHEGSIGRGQVLVIGADAYAATAEGVRVSLTPLTAGADVEVIVAALPAPATGFVAVGRSDAGGWVAARTCRGEIVRGDASETCMVDGQIVAGGLSLFSFDAETQRLVPMASPDPETLGFEPVLRSPEVFEWGEEVLLPVTDSEMGSKFVMVAASAEGWRVVGDVPSDADWIRFCHADEGLVVHAVDYPSEITQPIVGDRFFLLDTEDEGWHELATDGLNRTTDSFLLTSACVDGSMFLLDQASEPASGINDTPESSGSLYRYFPDLGRADLIAEYDTQVALSDPAVDGVFFLAIHDESTRDQVDQDSIEFAGSYLVVGEHFDPDDAIAITRPDDRRFSQTAPLTATEDGTSVWYSAPDTVVLERKS